MVLEIRLRNFYSIKDEIILDMRAGSLKKNKEDILSDNLITEGKYKVLKTAALYGANASGKSNIIKAIKFCCSMIFNSHNHNEDISFNFVPFKFENYKENPSSFFIRFLIEDIEYEYSFSLYRDKIVTEKLYFYPNGRPKRIFERDETLGTSKKDKYKFGNEVPRPMDVANNTSTKSLFISRASQMDREIGKKIFEYFANTLIFGLETVAKAHQEKLFNQYGNIILKALQFADFDITDIRLVKEQGKAMISQLNLSNGEIATTEYPNATFNRYLTYHRNSPEIAFDMMEEESKGTQHLFFMMLSLIYSIKHNKVLFIDEIESSLHSDIVKYIISLFKTSEKAQLIFSTHNTNLLDFDDFRKDQIYFVNKKVDASTDLYSLYDYKDLDGFRAPMNLEKAYLQGRFDAVPHISTSVELIKDMIDGQE